MKDLQSKSGGGNLSGVPVLSPLLHVLAMPAVVFLRFNFGFSYLSPKSIFIPLIFTGSVVTWILIRSEISADLVPLLVFLCSSSALYLLHLLIASMSQWAKSAEHDQYSGASFLGALLPAKLREQGELPIQGLAEPTLIFVLGFFMPGQLGTVLKICASSLALKEWMNAWMVLRFEKKDADAIIDAEARGGAIASSSAELPARGRIIEASKPRSSSNN